MKKNQKFKELFRFLYWVLGCKTFTIHSLPPHLWSPTFITFLPFFVWAPQALKRSCRGVLNVLQQLHHQLPNFSGSHTPHPVGPTLSFLASWTHKLANSLVLTSFWPWAALCTLEPASNFVPFLCWNKYTTCLFSWLLAYSVVLTFCSCLIQFTLLVCT